MKLLKVIGLGLAITTAFVPPAHAIEIGVALVALQAVAGQALIGAGLSFNAAATVLSVAGTVASTIVSSAIGFALSAAFGPSAPKAPTSETTGNFTQDEPARFLLAGRWRKGGNVSFAATKDGEIFKQIAHGDSELTDRFAYYLNDVRAELDGDVVINDEFATSDRFFTLTTRTGQAGQAVQPHLLATFGEWTPDHVGAGVCDTLMHVRETGVKARAAVLRHRGVLGLGEPNVDVAGRWGRYYDPRLSGQDPDDDTTWGPNLGNPALTWAWHRTHPERFAMLAADIDWEDLADQANICDALVTDRYDEAAPRYECGIAIDKQRETNISSEARILSSCDGIVIEQDDGRLSIRVGNWAAKRIVLTDDDIFDIQVLSRGSDDETPTHFFASYTEPGFGYVAATSAEWVAPGWTPDQRINKANAPLYACLNHRQAVTLAKAAGERQRETRSVELLVNLRGLQLKQVRDVTLDLADQQYAGDYEVASVVDNYDGQTVSLSLIGTNPNRHVLLDGEEGPRPNIDVANPGATTVPNIASADMVITQRASGDGAQLLATFPAPERDDLLVFLQYRLVGSTTWADFFVRSEVGEAESPVLPAGGDYEVQWRVSSLGGAASAWSAPQTITATGNPTAPGDVTAISITSPVAGQIEATFTSANDTNHHLTRIHLFTTANFANASEIAALLSGPGDTRTHLETGLAPEGYHVWLQAENGSGVKGTLQGPFAVSVA